MNRGVYRSSLVQQMMEGNPSLWSMMNSQEISMLLTSPSSSASSSLSSLSSSAPAITVMCPRSLQLPCHENQELSVVSWSQLLLGQMVEDGSRNININDYPSKTWKEEMLSSPANQEMVDVKEESEARHAYYCGKDKERYSWSSQLSVGAANFSPSPSPKYSVTSSNVLDFSHSNIMTQRKQSHQLDHCNTECNSNNGAASKKPRVQSSSVQSTLKVRKEKLGDRIAALHQLVSPFGKTDTASVLSEAIGYIRFLQTQIQALSSPYLGNVSSRNTSSKSELPTGACTNSDQCGADEPNALRSRGLCLVPVSFLLHVGSDDNGVDLWSHNFEMVLR